MLSIETETNKEWSNWSGSVACSPKQIFYPKSIEEVVTIVRRAKHAGRYIRVVGTGHSFTPLVYTDQLLLSLDQLQGIESINHEDGTVTVWAGTKLRALGEALAELGYAQENLGDIDAQSIAGAISTGTHGTGIQFGSISTQAVGFTVITSEGKILECSTTKNAAILHAVQLSLGLLGIIVKVTLRVVPSYRLHQRTFSMELDECLASIESLRSENRNFEFFYFPYTNKVQVKLLNETTEEVSPSSKWQDFKALALENWIFGFLSTLCRMFPKLSKSVSKLSASGIPSIEKIGASHHIYATPRLVRFNEMEYFIPIEHMEAVLCEISETIEREKFAVHFPIECRFVKGDDIWLSPAYKRDSAVIAVHMFKGMPDEKYFQAMEEILQRYEGRPHWGKKHTFTKEQAEKSYPKWTEFLKLRALFDPYDTFLNPYLHRLFSFEQDTSTLNLSQRFTTEQLAESIRTIELEQ